MGGVLLKRGRVRCLCPPPSSPSKRCDASLRRGGREGERRMPECTFFFFFKRHEIRSVFSEKMPLLKKKNDAMEVFDTGK